MKLLEFFQENYPDKTLEQVRNDPDVGPMLTKVDVGGDVKNASGKYASAYANKSDSASIFKIGITGNDGYVKPAKDPYLNYINKIKNLKLPVFPQIHSIQIFQHQDERYKDYGPQYCFKINMERLYEAGDLNEREQAFLLHRLLGRELSITEIQTLKKRNNKLIWYYTDLLLSLAWFGRAENIDEIPLSIKISDVQDRYLQTALTAIKSVRKVKKADIDIHSGNVMFRRTPYGVQPVVTDPIS